MVDTDEGPIRVMRVDQNILYPQMQWFAFTQTCAMHHERDELVTNSAALILRSTHSLQKESFE
ncbi:hypothetical protein D3C85_1885280 [compost metagenome]